jgi:hypothetical protein
MHNDSSSCAFGVQELTTITGVANPLGKKSARDGAGVHFGLRLRLFFLFASAYASAFRLGLGFPAAFSMRRLRATADELVSHKVGALLVLIPALVCRQLAQSALKLVA